MISRNLSRLSKRLKEEFNINISSKTFQRTYAGHHQRSAGAWSWFASTNDNPKCIIGSQETLKRCSNSNAYLVISPKGILEYEIDVYMPGEIGYVKK